MEMKEKEKNNKKNSSRKRKSYFILAVCLFLGFAICAAALAVGLSNKERSKRQLEQLQAEAEAEGDGKNSAVWLGEETKTGAEEGAGEELPEEPGKDILKERGIEVPEKELDFAQLTLEVNEDIFAWIYLPGTQVDYPMVRHPSEDSYYLNRNLDGSSGYPGCIYVDPINAADFSDPNTVIYGHNMKDRSMFGSLKDFRDRQFFDENRYLYIYTAEKVYVYDIFAAYEYSNIHLIYNFDLENDEIFQNYLDQVLEIRDMDANIEDGITLTSEDRIVTLSTCVRNEPNKRYLVQGVLLYAGEY